MSKPKTNKTKKPVAPKAKTPPKKAKPVGNGKHPEDQSAPIKAGLAPVAAMPTKPPKESKLALIIKLLSRADGATIDDIVTATGWQKHTVRAAISHALAKKRGYQIVSDKPQGGQRNYRIVEPV
jgi:hypothetical protein